MVSLVQGLFVAGLLPSLAVCVLGIYSYREYDEPGVLSFAVFAFVMGLSGIVGGIASLTLGLRHWDTVVWGPTAAIGVVLWALPWGLFGLQYTGRYTRLSRRTLGVLVIPYVATAFFTVLQFTTGVDLDVIEPLLGGILGFYLFGLVAIGIGLVLKTTVEYGHLSLWGGVALCVGTIWNTLAVNTASALSGPVTLASLYVLAFAVPALGIGVAIFRYDVFEATPAVGTIGERELTQRIDDLIFVADDEGHVIKLNEAAVETLGVARTDVLGRPIDEHLGYAVGELRTEETVTLETDDGTHRYDSQVSRVADQHGRELGALVSLRDVTDRELREQRLTVLNRVLRHNLRNNVEVVKSHAEVLGDHQNGDHVEAIAEAAETIADLGQSARTIDQFVAVSADATEVDIVDAVDHRLDALGVEGRAVSVTVDGPSTAPVETNRDALDGALDSALDNALTYAETSVDVTITDIPSGYEVAIADDGPGIPDSELDSLDSGTETALQHGTGLGLWQLMWAVRTMGGELEFDTSDGTTVAFTVPDQ